MGVIGGVSGRPVGVRDRVTHLGGASLRPAIVVEFGTETGESFLSRSARAQVKLGLACCGAIK